MFYQITFLFMPAPNHPATSFHLRVIIHFFYHSFSATPSSSNSLPTTHDLITIFLTHLNIGKRSHDHSYHFPPKAQQQGGSNSHFGHAVSLEKTVGGAPRRSTKSSRQPTRVGCRGPRADLAGVYLSAGGDYFLS